MKQNCDGSTALDGKRLQTAVPCRMPNLILSSVITALARSEGVDLTRMRLPYTERFLRGDERGGGYAPRLLDWSAKPSTGFNSPQAARKFFEEYELFPGFVVRGWDHPEGRFGFGLDGDRVTFELHIPSAGLFISGTPETVTIALRDKLPEMVCVSLVGKPFERLVAWPPACGPDYIVVSVEAESGIQVVTICTTPMTASLGASGGSFIDER